ncbi:MAG: CpXC domain-containing protein [Acetatifactor sp.]|nr:CpXC domain-containing protein [Acetatifactor sp.]MDE7045896.1 CpXC domain-containing protein [Acetatifactor sp.]
MNQLHTMKNPWASSSINVQCQHCNNVFTAQRINCFDTLLWPEGRQVLDEEDFFHPVCPHCRTRADLGYPSRYIDRELGIAAVLVPGIENQDTGQLFPHMNRYMDRLALDRMEHRAVGSFYSMAEQMRIHQHHLNDKAVQLLKPFMIGGLQSQGLEVWNGFFTGLLHPEGQTENTVYFSIQEEAKDVYTEDVYQFHIYLTNGDIIPQGINDTAYRICMNMLEQQGLAEDDGLFHLYDLAWAIDFHNSLQQEA